MADPIKLMLDGKEIYRDNDNNSSIGWSKQLLFKEGKKRNFELRTVEKDSLIASFSPNDKEKEDFAFSFLYAPEFGGLLDGLEMREPAEGMMNFKLQVSIPETIYQGAVDIVILYETTTNPETYETTQEIIKTIKGYQLNSGFADEIIEVRAPELYRRSESGSIIKKDNITIYIYKAGTEEEIIDTWGAGTSIYASVPTKMYQNYPYGTVLTENLTVAGDQDWIIIKEAEWGGYDVTTLKVYFWDPEKEAPRPGEPGAQPVEKWGSN